jgi:hypothetical protein
LLVRVDWIGYMGHLLSGTQKGRPATWTAGLGLVAERTD